MNIRKKIIFNASSKKFSKPQTSDTTAYTKNSAILQQSKTFKFINQKMLANCRQRNYFRTQSNEKKEKDLSCNLAILHVNQNKQKNIMRKPSTSEINNENFQPIKKNITGKRFLVEEKQLPPLSLKQTKLINLNKERKSNKFLSFQSIASNRQNFKQNSKNQSVLHQQFQLKAQPLSIKGFNSEEIEKRRQKLNSLNIISFYTTQKSIALSKHSILSKQSLINQTVVDKNFHFYSIQSVQKPFQVKSSKQQSITDHMAQTSQKNQDDQLQESIVQQIQKNQSFFSKKTKNIKQQQCSSNQWTSTIKSSFEDQSNHKYDEKQRQNRKEPDKIQTESQLSQCQSKSINKSKLKQCKKIRNGFEKNFDNRSLIRMLEDINAKKKQDEQSSLAQSYQIETPSKSLSKLKSQSQVQQNNQIEN